MEINEVIPDTKDIRKDYPEFVAIMDAHGYRVLGFMKVKYPAYCMHLDFTMEMKDPFYAYDRSICRCYNIKSDANQNFLEKVLGLGEGFFISRKQYLLDNSFLQEEDDHVYVSQLGHKHYLTGEEFQIEVETHKDILVDGRTFDMWSDSQKDDISEWNKSDKPDLCYAPISGMNDEVFDCLLEDIKKMEEQEMENFLGIEGRSKNFRFSSNSIDMCCIHRWIYIHQEKSTGRLGLDVVDDLGNESLGNLNALTFGINKFGQLYTSTETEHIEDGKSKYLVLPYQDKDAAENAFIRIIEKEYGLDEITHFKNESNESVPIRLKVSLANLQHSRSRSSLIAALKSGYHVVRSKDGSFILVPILPDSTYVHQLLRIDTDLQVMIDNKQNITLSDISRICPYNSWREALTALGRYDVIEQIDFEEYINKN